MSEEKKCIECGKKANFYWRHDGIKRDLCFEHYEKLEIEIHKMEKSKRLLKTMLHITSRGNLGEFEKCGNGKDCPYCAKCLIN